MKKTELLDLLEDIANDLEGKNDPYAAEPQVWYSVLSKIYNALERCKRRDNVQYSKD